MVVPAFLREHRFALTSNVSAPSVIRTHAQASTALAAITAHGTSVALAAALLQSACALATSAAPGSIPVRTPRAFLPLLRAELATVVEAGAARNARRRHELRQAVARVVFADAEWPRRYGRYKADLAHLAHAKSRALRGEARRLRSVVRAARDAVAAAVAEHAREPLDGRVWGDVDYALAAAVGARDDSRGGDVDAACAELAGTIDAIVASAKVRLSVGDVAAGAAGGEERPLEMSAYASHETTVVVRGGASVRGVLRACRAAGRTDRIEVASELTNVGDRALFVSGVSVVPTAPSSSTAVLVPVYATLPTRLESRQASPASVEYSTVLRCDDSQRGPGGVTVIWDVHVVV
jgi:hypothetical protein